MRRVLFAALASLGIVLVLGATQPAYAQVETTRNVSGFLYYYDLTDGFDDWIGVRIRGIDTESEKIRSAVEVVAESRGDRKGGIGQYFFWTDLNPSFYLFGTAGVGVGDKLFLKNKIYLEANWKAALGKNFVGVVGVGRNGYGSTWDIQTTLGATYYMDPFILQGRWFRYNNTDQERKNDSYMLRADWLRVAMFDVGLMLLSGTSGYRIQGTSPEDTFENFDETSIEFDMTTWIKRGKSGIVFRGFYGKRKDSFTRTGIELGPTVSF